MTLILTSIEFEVLGFVMDHGNTAKCAKIACRLLYECGLGNIPVIIGRYRPKIIGEDKELTGDSHHFIWAEGFDKVKPIRQNVADFIIENLKKYPNEVILITVGTVSNMRDVIEKDPNALKLAKKWIFHYL